MDLYTRVWCVLEMYIAAKKMKDEELQLDFVGMSTKAMTFDSDWLEEQFPNDFKDCKSFWCDNLSMEDQQMQATLVEKWGRKFADAFIKDNPLDVRNANASVQKDKELIMDAIGDLVEEVNTYISTMRVNYLSRCLPVVLDG
mmetsp:Transcript_51873/g.117421  ORF Transcript_51873/g.117421 Transcript_51873/m.117421 type:complete len:142 (+) Transcript_51873:2-427(+)